VAERPLGWVAGSAMRLFVLALVASVSVTFVNTLPGAFTLDAGGALQVLFFGLTMIALAWFAPMLASEVVQGQPHLSGADAMRTGVGASFATAGGVFLASTIVRSAGDLVRGGVRAIGGRRGGGGSGGGASRPAQINYARMQPRPSSPSASTGKRS
jgi:type IV secretory pathway TrbL component